MGLRSDLKPHYLLLGGLDDCVRVLASGHTSSHRQGFLPHHLYLDRGNEPKILPWTIAVD